MKTTKLVLVVGASGSGKTTVARVLAKQLGGSMVESYTTRPRRTSDEVGHVFITEADYKKLPDKVAPVLYDGYHYCVTKDILLDAAVYVVEPSGILPVVQAVGDERDVFVVYITSSDDERRSRMKERGDSDSAISSRLKQDATLFQDMWAIADAVVSNETTPEACADIIVRSMDEELEVIA